MRADGGCVVGAVERRAAVKHAKTCRGAGNVRAVAKAVERVWVGMRNWLVGRAGRVGVVAVTDEVDPALHLGRGRPEARGVGRGFTDRQLGRIGGAQTLRLSPRSHGAWTAEIGMGVVDAGVDDADLDSLAVEPVHAVPHCRRPDVGDTTGVVGGDGGHGTNTHHALQAGQVARSVRGDDDLDPVVRRLVVAKHRAAQSFDLVLDRLLLSLQLSLELFLLTIGQRAGSVCVRNRHRVPGKLDDHCGRRCAQAHGRPDRSHAVTGQVGRCELRSARCHHR